MFVMNKALCFFLVNKKSNRVYLLYVAFFISISPKNEPHVYFCTRGLFFVCGGLFFKEPFTFFLINHGFML